VKKILPIVVLIVVIAVGGWWFLGKGKLKVSMPGEIKKEEGVGGEEFVGKLKEVMAKGIAYKCEFKNDYMSGTGYIKGKKYFAEIASEGQEGFMIMRDNCMYNWRKGDKQGVKMCFDPEMQEGMMGEGQGSPEGEYVCRPAVIADSKFELPSDVQFMDTFGEGGFGEME